MVTVTADNGVTRQQCIDVPYLQWNNLHEVKSFRHRHKKDTTIQQNIDVLYLYKKHQTCTTFHNTNIPVLIICTTKIYHAQKLLNHPSTNLLAYASHHRRWLDKFPATLASSAKLQEAAGLAQKSFKLSDDVIWRKDQLIFKHWNASPRQREIMLSETPPTAFMGIADNNCTAVMHCP